MKWFRAARAAVRALRQSDNGASEPSPMPARVEVREPSRPAPARSTPLPGPASGSLFGYANDRHGREHHGSYAVIDVETTGMSPQLGDRIIEVAIQRIDAAGRVEDEFATLINPDGRDTGPIFIHGISNNAVARAPRFADVADEVLARLDGAVIVAHNASFEERFLAAELAATGRADLRMPALDTLWLGRRTFDTPNHKLGTLAAAERIPLVDKHSALGDVRALGQLLPRMLERHQSPLRYPDAPMDYPRTLSDAPPPIVTRAAQMRRGSDGWMHSLITRLPMSANDIRDEVAEAYVELLAVALEDGKIVGDEARALAELAGAAGLGGAQVTALNQRFLEGLREAAFADDELTATELGSLTRAAVALAIPDYFDDLRPTVQRRQAGMAVVGLAGTAASRPARRCGHCRQPGHYRTTCPDLNEHVPG